jgi:hypothetical protein
MTRSGTPGAAGRLVARARRPAVRARQDFVGFHVTDVAAAIPAAEPSVAEIGPLPVRRRASSPEPVARPPVVFDTLGREPVDAPAPVSSASAVWSEGYEPATPPPPPVRSGFAPTGEEASESCAPPHAIADAAPVNARAEPSDWEVLTEPEPPLAVGASRVEPEPLGPARPASREARQPAARAADTQSTAPLPVPAPPARPTEMAAPVVPSSPPSAAPGGRAASPPPSAPPPPEPSQVLIDRIEVITPPARAAVRDPFASLAPRRSAASRHGRTG